ncbi:MAG: NifB/NifX family molybdenum-iron cluster-binding protein [bacterium]|jgi:predicted Fe-Mo cluster-binding NifX family protein|nr:NifB/NifX family molybdenum-iron cluster-binding protein [bacterium]
MKLCITSEGKDLASKVDPRFGRCQYFIIVDTDTLEFEAVGNPNLEAMGGAGIQSAQLVASKQAKAVVTGNAGPNAFQTLTAAGIKVFTGASGTIKETIERYKKGEYKADASPSVSSKSGMSGKQ